MPDDTTTLSDNPRARRAAAASAAEQVRAIDSAGAAFTEFGAQGIKTALRRQTEMFDVLQDISRDWFARATAEAEHAMKLPNKLSAAHTVPDALSVYNEWLSEWMNLCSEDGRRFIADSQRLMDKSASCFTVGAPGAST